MRISIPTALLIQHQSALRTTLPVPSINADEVIAGAIPPPAACESADAAHTTDGTTTRQITAAGPLTFNLEIPLDRRVREATPNQIGTSAHGTTVTLDRIVVTPSETKVYLRAFARSGGSGGTSVAPILHVAGKEIDAESTVGEEGEIVATYDAALYDDHSTWSLKVLTDPVMTDNSRSYGGIVTFALSMA